MEHVGAATTLALGRIALSIITGFGRGVRMESASLDNFMALNDQLVALAQAGVPLDMRLTEPGSSVPQSLGRISATIARRVNRGETLSEAVEEDEDLPAAYRSLVQFGLHTGDLSAALRGSSHAAESVDSSRFAFEIALVYPLIVCLLAYGGLIGFSVFLVPTLEGMHESMRIAPGPGLSVLQALRATLPYWAPIPPIVLLLLAAWRLHARSLQPTAGASIHGISRWLPGVSQILFQERCARFAAALAKLLDTQVPLDSALVIAGETSGDAELAKGAKSLSAAIPDGRFPPDGGLVALRFPPFLRWAIWHSEATTGRVRALQIAARTYHEAAERRAERMQTLAPIAALVLVGGTVTLLYGLALFVPVVEMLQAIAADYRPS